MHDAGKQLVMQIAQQAMSGQIEPQAFYQRLTETITQNLGVSRASFWRYTSDLRDKVLCLDLYDTGVQEHAEGAMLSEDDFAPYFAAMRRDNMIVATDARHHEATSCFNELYFEPNGIHSLLDVGINIGGKPFGLFCCEQVTFQKQWTDADVEFLRAVGTLCGMALKKIHATATA